MTRTNAGDTVATIVLLVILALLIPAAAGIGLVSTFAVDACAGLAEPCDFGLMSIGQWLGTVVSVIAFVVALIAVLIRSRDRARPARSRFWIPLLGAVVTVIAVVVGFVLVDVAVPNPGVTMF